MKMAEAANAVLSSNRRCRQIPIVMTLKPYPTVTEKLWQYMVSGRTTAVAIANSAGTPYGPDWSADDTVCTADAPPRSSDKFTAITGTPAAFEGCRTEETEGKAAATPTTAEKMRVLMFIG